MSDLRPSIEEIEDNLQKNLGVDNLCVRFLLSKYREADAKVKRLREAATELLEVGNLRDDTQLPHPVDDPKLWSARMQDAWDELRNTTEAAKEK